MATRQAPDGPRPTDLPWFKFYVSWAKQILDDDDPNLCTLSDSELGRLLKEVLRFVLTGETEQVNGNERWLYSEIVRGIRSDWEKNAMVSAKRSASQTARWQPGQAAQTGQASQTSQVSQFCQNGLAGQSGDAGFSLDKIKDREIEKDRDGDGDIDRDADRSVSKKEEKEKKEKPATRNLKDIFLSRVRSSAKSPEEIEAMKDYWNSRIKLKHPIITEGTIDRELATLDSLSSDPAERVCIIHQSIDKGWRGLFPLKDNDIIARVKASMTQQAGPAPIGDDAPEWMRKYQQRSDGS